MSDPEAPTLSAQVNKLGLNEDQKTSENEASELVAVVDDLLHQLGTKFNNLSRDMIGKMDEMGKRLDNLEAAIQAHKQDTNGTA